MSFDFKAMKVHLGETPKVMKSTSISDKDNPWLDSNWEYSLENSYDRWAAPVKLPDGNTDNGTYKLEIPGAIEKYMTKPRLMLTDDGGEYASEPREAERLTGEAGVAHRLIRDASQKLDIGVAIRWAPGRNGFVWLTWQARDKRERKNDTKSNR